jgi:hypothetical protein
VTKPLIIGQAPSRTSDPCAPLSGCSGRRLALLCGVPLPTFLSGFERLNLLPIYPGRTGKGDLFPIELARERAAAMIAAGTIQRPRTVLLGAKVAEVFGLKRMEALRWYERDGVGLALCPHPSSISLFWNDPENVERARKFWRELADYASSSALRNTVAEPKGGRSPDL